MNNLISLTMKELNRYEVAQKLIRREISEEEGRKIMGLRSVRQVRRIKKKAKERGAEGLVHGNRGHPGHRRLGKKFTNKIMKIVREKYADFKPTFAMEKLEENHAIKISKESLRGLMTKAGLWKPKSRKQPKKRHVWRSRKDNFGEMQQFDGSYHKWFEDRGGECCLLLSIDDATGKVTHAKFDYNEGVEAVFRFWLEYLEQNGIPVSTYLDKFSTYKVNHPSAVDNKDLITQFQRATRQIGMELITAHSAEAKGRVERVFGTLQDRLVKELRLANIDTFEEANKFLKEKFIPKFNEKFAVVPNRKANLHRSINKELKKKLPQIFSIQSQRKVCNDYTIMFKNQFFQLDEKQPTTVFKKDGVIIEEHLDGSVKINLKDCYLNYQVLPRRPKKQSVPIIALTGQKAPWIPPADHPWRKGFPVSNKLNILTAT